MCNNTGMSEMPLEPDSPDDDDHYASEDWYTDGGSHLEVMIDRTISVSYTHLTLPTKA